MIAAIASAGRDQHDEDGFQAVSDRGERIERQRG
jgi:hypothetical protein